MREHYKITLTFRSYDILYEYQKKSGKTFWDILKTDFEEKHSDWKADLKLIGLTRAEIILDTDTELTSDTVKEYIGSFLEDKKECIVVFSKIPEDGEGDSHPEAEQKEQPVFIENIIADTDDSDETDAKAGFRIPSSDASVPKINKVDATVFEEAKKLDFFKSSLLDTVLGQRHAIDEFAEAVFECDGFAKNDKGRKGPLASMLFVGPSGVGKTYTAELVGDLLGRKTTVLDMSEYSDGIAYNRLNGEAGFPSPLINFIKKYPNGIVVFDEIEKAHITAIHLLLQILDEGRIKGNVSFKDAIIILTTNAGSSLYDDPTVFDLSGVPKRVILDALGTDVNPLTGNPFFPECITTRFANGHVVLFNHLEPYSLMGIVAKELQRQINLFSDTYGIHVSCDLEKLAATVLYSCGGAADARTLKGAARQMIVRELQQIVMQIYKTNGEGIGNLRNINITIDSESGNKEVKYLFESDNKISVVVLADQIVNQQLKSTELSNVSFEYFDNIKAFKERSRRPIDFVIIDPFCNIKDMQRIPNDIEDIVSDGMDAFRYMKKYFSDIPVYALDARQKGAAAYSTIVSSGCRGVVEFNAEQPEKVKDTLHSLSLSAIVNNNAFKLGRSGKTLTYNTAQFTLNDAEAEIVFTQMEIKTAARSSDKGMMAISSENGIKFENITGCKKAKAVLTEFCEAVKDLKTAVGKGKRIPKGVLLYGPPGTGKTMLARAMANEADLPFFQTTATAFFNKYVGQTEQNIRDLFAKARRYAPAVIFIDEVDSLAKNRSGLASSGHNQDALTAFLAEMDGFVTDEKRPVLILAATNYDISPSSENSLDPAFVRRFDEKIYIDLPDCDDRQEFFKMELAAGGIDFGAKSEQIIKEVAERSAGLSNADLHTIVKAFLQKCNSDTPKESLLMDALDEFRYGEVNKIDEKKLRQTAYHEAGHALINRLLGYTPAFLTITSRGDYGGFMQHSQDELKNSNTFNGLMNRVCCSLAGRASEIVVYGSDDGLNTGASQDIKTAREYIKLVLDDFAMGKTLYIADVKDYKEEAESLMAEQFERAKKLLADHRTVLDGLVELLMAEKNLDKLKLDEYFTSQNI